MRKTRKNCSSFVQQAFFSSRLSRFQIGASGSRAVESEGKDGEGGSETNVLPEAELQGRCKDALCAECPPGGLGRPQPVVRPAVEGCSLHPHRSPAPNNHNRIASIY